MVVWTFALDSTFIKGIIDSEMGCEEEWEEGQDAKSSQAEESSMFKSCLAWHLGAYVGRAHAQPGWGFLGMSHIAGLEASPWPLTPSLQVSSPGSLQIARRKTTKYGSEIFVKEYLFFFLLACNRLWKSRPRMSPTVTYKSWIWSTFTVCSWTAPGGALTYSVISLAPRPSQWGRRVGRLTLLLCKACSQASAFLVVNLAVGSVSQLLAPSTELVAACRGPGLRSLWSLAAAQQGCSLKGRPLLALFPSSVLRLRTSCCSPRWFLSSPHLPSEAKHGRFFVFVFLMWTIFRVCIEFTTILFLF